MGRKKHILFVLALAAVMAFGVSTAAVHAEQDAYFKIGGEKYYPDQSYDHQADQGWKYDPQTGMTMDGMGTEGNVLAVEFAGFDLTVDLKNKNAVSSIMQEDREKAGNRTLKITGGGSLDINNSDPDNPCIAAENVQVTGGALNLSSAGHHGVACDDSFEMSGEETKVTVEADLIGIYATANATVEGGTLDITSGFDGINATNAEISGTAKVIIAANAENGGRGIGASNTTIKGGTVKITGRDGIAFWEELVFGSEGKVTMTGGSVTIDAGHDGINVKDAVISGGTLDITGATGEGIKAEAAEISGTAKVTIVAANRGIGVLDTTIKGGTVEITGNEGIGPAMEGDVPSASISGGTVTIHGEGFGIHAEQADISGGTVSIDSNVVDPEEHNTGIDAQKLSISGGTVTIADQSFGAWAEQINISGGSVNAEAKDMGLSAETALSISGKNTRVEAEVGTDEKAFPLFSPRITISSPLEIITPEGGRIAQLKEIMTNDATVQEVPDDQIIVDKNGEITKHVVIAAREYKVTVQEPQNGTLSADRQKAIAGDKVKVTAKPASGYVLDKLTYTDAAGKVTAIGSSGQFTMPASDVTVKATFKKKTDETLLAKMTAKGGRTLKLSWTKMKNVDGYDIFFSRCDWGTEKYKAKKVKTIKGNKTFKWTKKGLKKSIPYKAYVKAWVMKDGKKTYVAKSPSIHAYTNGFRTVHTNPKSVKVKKSKATLKVGQNFKIKAKVTKLKKGKKLISKKHVAKLRYYTSNKKVATVTGSGKVKAAGKGSCKIYVLAANGARKTVSITVK